MTPTTLFYILVSIIIFSFILEKLTSALNAKHFKDTPPQEVKDVYNHEEYKKSQAYKATNYKFSLLTSSFTLLITLTFLCFDGFALIDYWARTISQSPIVITLLFFGTILLGSELIMLPFSYYNTFNIEERFGFNKTTIKTFFLDKIKGLFMSILIGCCLLAALVWFYQFTTSYFWLYAWALITVFTLLMNLFYARLIVPLFNKQTPLEEGSLKNAIANYAASVGFKLNNIFVIDGSKRSTKANAYFSGFGREKRITLYDTLINDLDNDEIVSVLAHEVGHYKKNHIIYNLIFSVILTGITLYILSIFIENPLLSKALGVDIPSFHIGLVAFGFLYAPISEITGLCTNYMSRKFEYEADDYAKNTFKAEPLISSLKKLSKNSLGNLTPHPAYVFLHYSHPTLANRIKNLRKS